MIKGFKGYLMKYGILVLKEALNILKWKYLW